jgi:glyoxylase-like metal-dependent hydrolase (beta-lactamase superfamily II)
MMAEAQAEYEVFAIRYVRRDAMRRDHFIMGDPHDAPMPMDYFLWAAISPERSVIIDTGFTRETAEKRGREFLRCPVESLELVGLDPDEIRDVIITHLHYDHAGNFQRFANARFHVQEKEILFAAGRHMRHPFLAHSYEVEDIVALVRANFARRVAMYEGPAEVAPGITIHPVGGHTPGVQFVRVHTRRGWVVLASDVTHYYENMERGRPFPAATNIPDVLEAFDKLVQAAPTRNHIIPGHDPLVTRRYPSPAPGLEGIVVRLDVEPISDR